MKKIISLVLAMIMVFAIGATAFAATYSLNSPHGHEHEWSDWEVYDWGRKRTCEECGITEFEYFDGYGPEDEKNPNTGATGILVVPVLVSAAAVASFKRR